MDERVMQFRVGVMIFATLIITAILVVMFGKLPAIIHGTYTLHIKFPEAPGVTVDTPVRKSGIRIGRVTKVEFTEDDQVMVTAQIDAQRRLRHNETCYVTTTLLGDSSLQFMLSPDKNAPRTPLENNETVEGKVAAEPAQVMANLEGRLSGAIESVNRTSVDLGGAARRISDILEKNEGRINSVIEHSDETLQALQKSVGYTNEMLGDAEFRKQFKQSLMHLPQMMDDMHTTINRMGGTIDLVDRNLKNVEGFTRPLGERGEQVISRLDAGAQKLDAVMTEMLQFSKAINNPEGALGQLVNNPELYQHLNRAARNVDEATRQLQPIVDDARVFTDKVARHPGVIVRDAVRPGPGIK